MQPKVALVLAVAALAACTNPPPTTLPSRPTPGPAVIHAPVTRTWSALVQYLAGNHIATTTNAPSSGIVETRPFSPSALNLNQPLAVADCGSDKTADSLSLSFLVRGDSTRSTVEVTPRFVATNGSQVVECRSTGQAEHQVVEQVKAAAEGTR